MRIEFDAETGLVRSVSGMRFRDHERTKTPYRGESTEWKTVHGTKAPHHNVATWEDMGESYVILDLEGVEYNVK